MKRAVVITVFILFLFASLPVRMIYLILNADDFPDVSNSSRSIVLSELRGEIYDYKMNPLVNRKSENVIVAKPCKEAFEILKSYLTAGEREKFSECINSSEPFVCICDYSEENELIKTARKYKRYTDDGFCCHVLGYVNESDNIGVYGIEKSYDTLLKEDNRRLLYNFNASAYNKMLAGGENKIVSENYYSQKGVRLTIDADIQRIAENAMKLYDIEKGAVVVLDSSNGEIRAMASTPTFNQNDIASSLNDENSPFLNRAVNSYSVGSVFKLVVAAAAVKTGIDNFESYCDGSLKIGDTTFSCSNCSSHGKVNLQKAFAYSCNTYFIRLALKIGAKNLLTTAENLGFGKSFSLADGIFSSAGNLPSEEDIATDGMLANLSFGQGGLLASPLQVALCYAAAVNGGNYISPKLVVSTVNSDSTENVNDVKQYKYRALSKTEAEKLKDILMNNFREGTCVGAKPENAVSGGKTSTAETGWLDEKGKEVLHSWFAGFTECKNTTYTIVVFCENGVSGSLDCGPVFKEIAQRTALL